MATWGDQTCQRFEATAVGFETGFSRLSVWPSNLHAIAPHMLANLQWFEDRSTRGRCYGYIVSVTKNSGGFPKGLVF